MPNTVSSTLIDGVIAKKLAVYADGRGRVVPILSSLDDIFSRFGRVYLTTVFPGVIKEWHFHQKQFEYFTVIRGAMKMALYDGRDGSSTQGLLNEFSMNGDAPVLLKIPPDVIHGLIGLGEEAAMGIICGSEPYNHDAPDKVPVNPQKCGCIYDWNL